HDIVDVPSSALECPADFGELLGGIQLSPWTCYQSHGTSYSVMTSGPFSHPLRYMRPSDVLVRDSEGFWHMDGASPSTDPRILSNTSRWRYNVVCLNGKAKQVGNSPLKERINEIERQAAK
ncbi:MAG: hypothetical protein ACUVRO_04665, partial [Armatimonadota bacterium]